MVKQSSFQQWTQQEAMMKRLAATFVLLVYATLVGCNTMAGLGRDIERGGEKLQGEAREEQRH
jgi:predicted small secreted protein